MHPSSANYGLIVAGGAGTRLWPLSRTDAPKQLHILGESRHSLLQETFARLSRSIPPERIKIVTSRRYSGQVLRQLRAVAPGYPESNLLAEPVGRDSGPAILWGALAIGRENPAATVTIVWCDQHIGNVPAFDHAVAEATVLAAKGELVVIGVTPTHPGTGLGYIKFAPPPTGNAPTGNAPTGNAPTGNAPPDGAFPVERFTEKPDLATAEKFLAEGGYVWNVGLFVFHVESLLDEFRRLAPEYMDAFGSGGKSGTGVQPDWNDPDTMDGIFAGLPHQSFDYLVLEKSKRLLVIPAELDWSDLGAWDEVYRKAPKDDDGNAIQGKVMALATRNSLIHGNHRLIATIGVENLMVIDTPDALLICDMGKAQEVKKLVEILREARQPQADISPTVHRPWGSFTVLWEGEGYKLKMIEVQPGQKLSLQMHHRRAEHWVVIEGRGEMTLGEEVFSKGANETFHIPQGEKHTVANPGPELLRFVEVQFGDYLGEDDIVRFEDQYGRV